MDVTTEEVFHRSLNKVFFVTPLERVVARQESLPEVHRDRCRGPRLRKDLGARRQSEVGRRLWEPTVTSNYTGGEPNGSPDVLRTGVRSNRLVILVPVTNVKSLLSSGSPTRTPYPHHLGELHSNGNSRLH